LLKPADDPRQTAAYLPQRQHDLLRQVQVALADMAHIRDKLAAKTAVMHSRLCPLEEQARQALHQGQEENARLLLRRRQITTIELQTIAAQLDTITQKEQRLLAVEQHLIAQIEAYVARQEEMAARYHTAVSQTQVNKAIQDIFRDLGELGQTIADAEAHTEVTEARADWLDASLADELWMGTAVPLNGEYRGVETAVEAELARLKAVIANL
jgi:phage shock protein A